MTFSPPRASSTPLYRQLEILQFRQQVELQNVLFVNSSLNKLSPIPFQEMFTLCGNASRYNLRNPLCLVQINARTNKYGLYSIKSQCIYTWNNFVNIGLINNENCPMSNNFLRKHVKSHCFALH